MTNGQNNAKRKSRNLSDEGRRNIVEAAKRTHTGRKRSKETRRKISQAMLGKKHIMSEVGKASLAEAAHRTHTGRKRSQATCDAISQALLGRSVKESTKEKLREANLGKSLSAEHRLAISEGVVRHKLQKGLKGAAGFRGMHYSDKCDNPVKYKSSYELSFMKALDADPDVLYYLYEPMAIRYEYLSFVRHYIPDFQVVRQNCIELIEVRPRNLQSDSKSIAKFQAARRFCELCKWTFLLVSREDIRHMPIRNQARCPENVVGSGKAQRLIGDAIQANKPDTSAGLLSIGQDEEIVRYSGETRRLANVSVC